MLNLVDQILEAVWCSVTHLLASTCFPKIVGDVRHARIYDLSNIRLSIAFSDGVDQIGHIFQFVQCANQNLMSFHIKLWDSFFPADAVNGGLERISARLKHLVESLPQRLIHSSHVSGLNHQLLSINNFLGWICKDVGQFRDFVHLIQLNIRRSILEF